MGRGRCPECWRAIYSGGGIFLHATVAIACYCSNRRPAVKHRPKPLLLGPQANNCPIFNIPAVQRCPVWRQAVLASQNGWEHGVSG